MNSLLQELDKILQASPEDKALMINLWEDGCEKRKKYELVDVGVDYIKVRDPRSTFKTCLLINIDYLKDCWVEDIDA